MAAVVGTRTVAFDKGVWLQNRRQLGALAIRAAAVSASVNRRSLFGDCWRCSAGFTFGQQIHLGTELVRDQKLKGISTIPDVVACVITGEILAGWDFKL